LGAQVKPVQRGGAGGADRTFTVTAGPACAHQRVTRFTFAIRWAKSRAARAKRAAAVAEHLEEVPGAVVVEERAEGARLHLTVAVWPPLRADEAERVIDEAVSEIRTAALGRFRE
jgi:hypothetical protein